MKTIFKQISIATTLITLISGCGKPQEQQNSSESTSPVSQKEQLMTQRITKPSGFSYEIIVTAPENAKSPTRGKLVTVHYTGWLNQDGKPGKKFDSSKDRNEPFQFPIGIGYVIKGWDEGVADMKVGEKRMLYIPSSLGYGSRGAGGVIPANADLIFEVELLDVE
jgi:FKBP-type peptidyl-prolyl cis-trans isomerase